MIRSLKYYKNYIFQVFVKRLLQKHPSLYIKTQIFRYRRHPYKKKIISKNTDIVIEGYPRSANSFSVKAFKQANGNNFKIATHLHTYPQVIVGIKYNIPILVLIRNPFDSVLSYAALRGITYGIECFNKNNNIKWLLKDYVIFYKNLKPYKNKIIVADFSEVLEDYGDVIKRINNKFNTEFIPFYHSKENIKLVFNSSKNHLSPSKERDRIKLKLSEQLNVLKNDSLYKEAEELYSFWTTSKIN